MIDPKVVLEAHALRSQASAKALLHGSRRPRTQRTVVSTLFGSTMLAAVIVTAVIVTNRIVTALHSTGH